MVDSFKSRHPAATKLTEPREVIDLSNLEDDLGLRLPPARQSKGLSSLRDSLSNIVDLGSPESSANEDEDLARAVELSMHSPHLERKAGIVVSPSANLTMPQDAQDVQARSDILTSAAFHVRVAPRAVNTKTQSASELDQLRAARFKHFSSSPIPTHRELKPSAKSGSSRLAGTADRIDLTEA